MKWEQYYHRHYRRLIFRKYLKTRRADSKLTSEVTPDSHYTIDPYTWPWSPKGHGHGHDWPTPIPFCTMSVGPPICESWLFQNFTMKIHGQDHECGQRSSLCWFSNQSIYFLFIWHQSTLPFLRYSFLKIWPWKSKVKVMTKAKTNGYIWGLVFNRYIHFSFHGNRIILS